MQAEPLRHFTKADHHGFIEDILFRNNNWSIWES